MIVEHDDRRRAAERRFAKHVARLDDRAVQRPDRDNRRPHHAVLRVEQHDAELLDAAAIRTAASGTPPRRAAPRIWTRALGARVSVRRPSSSAATICAALAAPMPAIRAKIVARASAPGRAARRARRAASLATPSAPLRRKPLPSTSATSSLSPSARRAVAQQLLARPIVRRQVFHRTTGRFSAGKRREPRRILSGHVVGASSVPCLLVVAVDRRSRRAAIPRQGNAAGAGRDRRGARRRRRSSTRPTSSPRRRRRCKKAHDAVAQRDYRLALNYALDSRERAQNAAKDAADHKATARDRRRPRARPSAMAALNDARVKLKAAEAARASRPRSLASPRQAIDRRRHRRARSARSLRPAATTRRARGACKPLTGQLREVARTLSTRSAARRPAQR